MLLGFAAAALATAACVAALARRAERKNPPTGLMMSVGGETIHYVVKGRGPPCVLIHGSLVYHPDFIACGLVDLLALTHTVYAFDRPGYGYSSRASRRPCSPLEQAHLLRQCMARLGISGATVIGHSMGAVVGLALALQHPDCVRKLVLVGGYYYPSDHALTLLRPITWPVVGRIWSYTVGALSARLSFPRIVKSIFHPRQTPAAFGLWVKKELMLRPKQLRSSAEDAGLMNQSVRTMSQRYHEIQVPVVFIAGKDDRIVDPEDHSIRLHGEIEHSELVIVPGQGHMVHYAVADAISRAVNEVM